jgi:hypothetical protein
MFQRFAILGAALTASIARADSFGIHVVDSDTGRGVPLVELKTTNSIRYYTDSAGWVAFDEPGLIGQDVFFNISGHGYEFPADGFGIRGVRLKTESGGAAEIKIKRLNVAERLYRMTGGGIYRDSVILGRRVPTSQPLLNGLVFGQDSVLTTIYRGRVYWFWGDTGWPRYPLGNFQVAGATSLLPTDGGLAPDAGVDLTYFVNDQGFAKEMAPIPGDGPTWIDGVVVLHDGGRERMFAVYAKVRQDMSTYACGLLRFDDDQERFERIATWDVNVPLRPGGHTFLHRDAGVEYVYYTRPFPVVRIKADAALLADLANYECFTCLKPGSTAEAPELDRDEAGVLRWAWKRGAAWLSPGKQEELIKAGRMKPEEARFRLLDPSTSKPIVTHGASIAWNAYRKRWTAIVLEVGGGTSLLGEIWYAEADTPLGPWERAVKIITHDRYSFYNPRHHPFFDEDGGRRIYFEATYTMTFSRDCDPTPRYDYNQLMYRLDLDDPRLAPAR